MSDKQYIGDAVYIENDNFGGVILTTEDGISVTNTIVLEVEVIRGLINYLETKKILVPFQHE